MAYSKSNTTNVAFTDTSVSQVLSTKAKEVVVSATADCFISFDATTVSSTNGCFVAANQQYIFHILFPAQISVIRETGDGTLSVLELGDSMKELRVTYSATASGDSNLKKTVLTDVAGDASLKTTISSSFTGDSFLSITQYDTFTGDANLKGEYDFTGDADLISNYEVTFTGDASILDVVQSLAFQSDAVLVTA